MLRRIALAALAASAIVAAAVAAMYMTTAPAMLSLLIEPMSMLLLPGLAFAMAAAGTHDYAPRVAVRAAFCFYFALLLAGLCWRARRARFAGRGER